MRIDEQVTKVARSTVAKLNPLTNRPLVYWLNPVHECTDVSLSMHLSESDDSGLCKAIGGDLCETA